jgi:hypothetical protein
MVGTAVTGTAAPARASEPLPTSPTKEERVPQKHRLQGIQYQPVFCFNLTHTCHWTTSIYGIGEI